MPSHTNNTAAAGRSSLPSRGTVFGLWNGSTSSATVEVATDSNASLPASSPATYAAYHEPRNAPNALDNFFGAGALEAHRPLDHTKVSAPPPYISDGHEFTEKQEGVYAVEETPTLARMLFKYGFFFFPFWLAGIYILCSPLRSTPDWEAGKTEAEKAQQLRLLREIELKWARRCLYAMMALVFTVLLLVVIIKFGIMANI